MSAKAVREMYERENGYAVVYLDERANEIYTF